MMTKLLSFLQRICSHEFSAFWAVALLALDAALTLAIILKVPFTNVDWETYGEQVDIVLNGEFDYAKIQGSTGPIAYPAGFIYVYGALRLAKLSTFHCQLIFAGLYLATMGIVFQIYQRAKAPGWLLALCVLSKRSHSVFVLRLFNDSVTSTFTYLSILLLVSERYSFAAVAYSLAISIKMHPVLFCPAVGICIVLARGWSQLLAFIFVMIVVQLAIGAPFLLTNHKAYFARAFGGPGDLQQVWSVNWRFLPEELFFHKAFAPGLLLIMAVTLLWFAHHRWLPQGGVLSERTWRWRSLVPTEPLAAVALLFGHNFIAVVFLRTLHFQFVVWYFHMVPFLAWYAVRPDRQQGLAWIFYCMLVAALSLAVEIPYLLTGRALVRGPDGREWETDGVPTKAGSLLLQTAHVVLLVLLACRSEVPTEKKEKRG